MDVFHGISWDLSNFCGDYTDFTDFMVIHREFTNQKLPSGVGKRRDLLWRLIGIDNDIDV
jgi:hypothetical protein